MVGQTISQASKDAIAESALGLLEEQVQARIVHYKAELETHPELDAITAQVLGEGLLPVRASRANPWRGRRHEGDPARRASCSIGSRATTTK